MLKKLLMLIIVLSAVALGALFYAQKGVDAFLGQTLRIESPQLVTVKRGNNLNTVFSQFEDNGWIEASPFTQLVRRFHPELSQLKVGTFQLKPGIDLTQAIDVLNEGTEFQLAITFIEGSTFKEWREQLIEADHLNKITSEMSEADIAKALDISQHKLEGLFLAETYHYSVGDTDLDILRRAHTKLNRVLNKNWDEKQANLPLNNQYEALILASIIEKETAVASERERVASVFVNRLNRPMRLQTDPTVIYGMGDRYDGNIRKKDLREKTPYNTYVIDGLPPTPIAMPGEASIHAALNPEKSNYLYFVASGKGGHVFSKNLRDHNRAVQQYLRTIRSQK
ncbi:ABC transporter substrate-binding protein [Vibrio sp. 10N.286.49.C2]|uniref:endolytic transglycosylase MltG n=1 Tax=unclassified Vibrio TaxID=2614977 RepID=UPI000C85F214|nr:MULTISPECIES: endolytic transglycosylase MltG [unclassified Vibrio]PMH33745.1 ABC transporter substrate-binding protein [Vibrio sp. 10N.286.49.C2]PMH44002.1 ABC transporter substrate-binding protein [Vibrio sp. 10N.286.49.B1]PMH78740.1 ABC transporter substrate-binding protein [Vibrio sp. 10N.286.48.B7]